MACNAKMNQEETCNDIYAKDNSRPPAEYRKMGTNTQNDNTLRLIQRIN